MNEDQQYKYMLNTPQHARANMLTRMIDECIRDFEGQFPGWTLTFDVQDGMGVYYPKKKKVIS